MQAIKPVGNLWPFLKYSFLFYILAELALVLSNVLALDFWDKFQNNKFENDDALVAAATSLDMHQGLAGGIYTIAFVVSVVAFSKFFYRAMNNLHVVGAAHVVTSPFKTIGYYFVPILNLWKPLGAINQIWRGSHNPGGGDSETPPMIGWWWALWVTTGIFGNISIRYQVRAGVFGPEITDINILIDSISIDILSAVPGIASAMLVLRFAEHIVNAQETNLTDFSVSDEGHTLSSNSTSKSPSFT